MADKVRIGVIGCGGIANWHFGHLEKNESAHVVAVCDLIDERVQKAADRFTATPYKVYAEMLDKETLDAVYVCVEPCAHDGMELMAVEKGCHLFVQKPVALSMEYANKVKAAIEAKGVISCAGYQSRYIDTVPRVQAWLEGQDVGFFNAYYVGGMPMVWWWRRRETSGGQVVEQSTHTFDLLRFLFGDVTAVHAMGRRGLMEDVENYDTEDCSGVTMTFESGVIGTCYSGCFSGFGGKNGVDVFAKDGRLEYSAQKVTIRERTMTIELRASNDSGQDLDDTFIDAVLTGDASDILSSYADGCKTLELTLAVNESMDAGGKLIRLA